MDPKKKEIAYVTHPVSKGVKEYIMSRGYRIVDARFAPEGVDIFDGQGQAPEPAPIEIDASLQSAAGGEPNPAPKPAEEPAKEPEQKASETEANPDEIIIPVNWETELDWQGMKKLAAAIAPDEIAATSNKEQVMAVISNKVAQLQA